MGQESEDGSLRTQARLRFRGKDMAGTLCRAELRSHASEVRSRFRLWLRFEFLSMWAPSGRGGIMRPWGFSHYWSCEMLQTARIPSVGQLRFVGWLQDVL